MEDIEKKVLQQIERDHVIEIVEELIRADTADDEAPIVPVITGWMKKIGMDVEVYQTFDSRKPEIQRPCILGTLPGKVEKPLLCYNGHTDIVPVKNLSKWKHPPFDPIVEGGKLYGRGASDTKGG